MKALKQFAILAAAITVLGVSLAGCSAGETPPGMSGDDAKAAINKMPPEQKIRAIANSPMPQAEKDKEFAKIEAETGVKASTVLDNSKPTGTGAGG
jgi:PBP1b-binding outer membrane lipoprotein LpoB